MAKWDHADLLSMEAKVELYPEYCTQEEIKRYGKRKKMSNKTYTAQRMEQLHNKLTDLCELLNACSKEDLLVKFNLNLDQNGKWSVNQFDVYEKVKRQ